MKKWILKAIIQKTISFLPGSHQINFWFQKYVTKGVQLNDSYFEDKLKHAADHLRFYSQNSALMGVTSLELGTGWYPVVPICLYLAGAKQVTTIDLSRLMHLEALQATVKHFQKWLENGKLKHLELFFLPERMAQISQLKVDQLDMESLLLALNLDYRVGDARQLDDENDQFDLVHSNNVFEHVYPQVLKEILVEFKRVLKPAGLMSHFIDMSDHFAHLDQSITIYNFLRYSESAWKRIDNSVQPQNRWRLGDYEKLYRQLNFEIIVREARAGDPEALQNIKVAAPYTTWSAKDLAISHVHLVNTI